MRKYENNRNMESEYFAEPQLQDFPSPEYQPLPDEYLQQEHPMENRKREQKRKWMRMFCMLTACVLLGYSIYQAQAGQTQEAVPATTEEVQATAGPGENREDGDSGPVQSPAVETKTDIAIADTAESSPGHYPLEGGILYYKIYNETMLDQPTADEWERILEEGEIPVEQLLAGEVIGLPQPEVPEGFVFLGWAAHFPGEKETYPKWSLLTEAFTAEDAARIQPDENGNRSVDIHAVWRTQDPDAWQMRMVLDADGGLIEGQTTQTYNALPPKYSGGTVYLCGYPVPEREGYDFTGWYIITEEGKTRVETLPASRFFGEKNREPDYSQPLELHLIAGWEKTEEKGN